MLARVNRMGTVSILLFVLGSGCEGASDVSSTRASDDDREPGPRALELAGIRAEVPADYSPLDGASRDRLKAAATRRDPGARAEVEGASPEGMRLGLVLMRIVHDPEYGAGYPVAESAADAEQLARIGGEARGIAVETSSSCAERSCDVEFTLRGPALTTTNRSRMWRKDGRLIEVACQCVTTPEVDACALPCELPEPPAGATVE